MSPQERYCNYSANTVVAIAVLFMLSTVVSWQSSRNCASDGTCNTASSKRLTVNAELSKQEKSESSYAAHALNDVHYAGVIAEHPVCSFFRSNAHRHKNGNEVC